jgi:hypothetical protein
MDWKVTWSMVMLSQLTKCRPFTHLVHCDTWHVLEFTFYDATHTLLNTTSVHLVCWCIVYVPYLWLMFDKSYQNNWKKKGIGQLQCEYFRISTIVSKYARSINKFQSYLVFWARFDFIKFRQIVLSFFFLYIAGPLKN